MNRIARFATQLDQWLSPLTELAKDENMKSQLLALVGAKEKPTEQGKKNSGDQLGKLTQALDDLRKKMGLDTGDVPKTDNIVALASLLPELYKVMEALHGLLQSFDYNGLESTNSATAGIDGTTVFLNAVRAISRLLTRNALQKEHPKIAAMADAAGIFSDESTETARALDLVLFPLMELVNKIAGYADKDFNEDLFRPLGDTIADDHQRFFKGIFLVLSIVSMILEKKIRKAGKFLFNFGYELQPEKDLFPRAAGVAARVMQLQFIPGAYFDPKQDEWIGDELLSSALNDSLLSFATIPVFPANPSPGAKPAGFQYILGLDLHPGPPAPSGAEPGPENGQLSISFPANITGHLLWGHGIDLTASTAVEGPIMVVRWQGTKPEEGADTHGVNGGDIVFTVELKKTILNGQPKTDMEARLEFNNFSLSLLGEGRDGFIQKILPGNGAAKVNASFALVYAALLNKISVKGLDGAGGPLLPFKVDKNIFGVLGIPTLYMGLKPFRDEEQAVRGVKLESSAQINLSLGPFLLNVDRLGLFLDLSFPRKKIGNLGGAHLGLGLKPPTGVGFQVNATKVKGGGFLSFDPENHQYYGAGELSVKFGDKDSGLTIKVVAIILTRMPDGSKGFSFLLLATVEFNPGFELPFGFKLKGLGVLVALHRSMNLDNFREAVKSDQFNSILFPNNPVANAPAIVKTMNTLFPAAEGRYVFAIMGRIGWGNTQLVDIKAGLLIEVPDPIKLVLAGVVKLMVEAGGKKILRLQVNFLVALDLEKKIFSIDAAIYDSKFLIFDIKGQMFMRYRWGSDPVFLFALGGWHPDFQVPAGLNLPQKPQRITVPLLEGSNPSLILSCYMAITSNTVQAGFAIDFKMHWSKFRLEAGLSVDALFHFDPFYFAVDFEGKLRIFWGDNRLAGVSVKGKFSGTHPWRIKGKASFEIWIFSYDVDFDKSSGEKLIETSQDVEVLPLLQQALNNKASWQAMVPSGRSAGVVLRNTEADSQDAAPQPPVTEFIITDPFARLELMQQVVPLGIRIDKWGSQRVKGFRKFDLVPVETAGQSTQTAPMNDFFAPAMYLELTDAQKLSRKSYEPMKAGCSFSDLESVSTGAAQLTPFAYDCGFYDPLAPATAAPSPAIPEIQFQRWLANNSAGRSVPGRKVINAREAETRKPLPNQPAYVLVDVVSGNKITTVPAQQTMTGAYYERWKIQTANPFKKVQVVREAELT